MRANVSWSAVWGTCFVGGVLIGSTGPASIMTVRPSPLPNLRGSVATAPSQPNEGAPASQLVKSAERKDITAEVAPAVIPEQQKDAAADKTPDTHRALAKGDFDVDLAEGNGYDRRQVEQNAHQRYYGGRLGGRAKAAMRIRARNGGLWGPNEEEEREIAEQLAVHGDEEDDANPQAYREDEEGVLRFAASHQSLAVYSFSYFFEDDEAISYDFSA
ncbi:unnamed protein product [Scytosiphon promiscuus]